METSLDTLKVFRRNLLSRQLATRRANYRQQYGELAVGIKLLNYVADAVERGDERVRLRNGDSVLEGPLNEDFFRQNGLTLNTPSDNYEKMFQLLEKEIPEDFEWRKEAVRQYIKDSGLEGHTDEIIEGMNETAQRVTIWPDTSAIDSGNVLRCRQVLLHDSKALINFALDYVDRWQMYYELFSNVSK